MKRVRLILICLLIAVTAGIASAHEAKQAVTEDSGINVELFPPVTTDHSITIDGEKIDYQAKVGLTHRAIPRDLRRPWLTINKVGCGSPIWYLSIP